MASQYDGHIIEWIEYHRIIGVDLFYFYFDPRFNHSEEGEIRERREKRRRNGSGKRRTERERERENENFG